MLAPAVAQALLDAVARGDTGYPSGTDFARAYADFADDSWGWQIEPRRVVGVAGVMAGVMGLVELLVPPGGTVVVNTPAYPPFLEFPVGAGRRVDQVPLGENGRLDLAALEVAFAGTPTAGVYLLCSPHNPTGTVHTRAELEAVVGLAERHGVVVIADEIHAPLSFVPFTPLLTVTDIAYSVVSASKAWNLAALPAALIVAGAGAPHPVSAIAPQVRDHQSHLGAMAQTAALRDARPWLVDLLHSLNDRRTLLGELLERRLPEVGYRPPEATYLAWLDLRELRDASGELVGGEAARRFVRHGGVALSPGAVFAGSGFARVNFATSREILTEVVERMARAIGR